MWLSRARRARPASGGRPREVLADYTGIVVVDRLAVYEVQARDGLGLRLAHRWAHTKRKYHETARNWPTACAEMAS
jgi:hypothetical protein